MSELQETVGRNVRVLMAIRGIRSQRVLAEKVGVDYSNLNKKITGKNAWTLEDIEILADEFHVNPASLLGDGREFLDPNLRATGTSGEARTQDRIRRYVPGDRPARVIPFPLLSSDAPELPSLATVVPFPVRPVGRAPRPSLAVTG